MFRYLGFRLLTTASGLLSRKSAYAVARVFADLDHFFGRKRRAAIRDNLRVILPDADAAEIDRLAREVFRNFAKYLVEFFGLKKYGPELTRLVGRENLEKACASGRGVVILSAHLANWELGAASVEANGFPIVGVTQVFNEERSDRMIARQRASRGYRAIPSKGALRQCLAMLRSGKTVVFVADRDVGEGSVEVDFFGRKTPLPIAPAMLAVKTNAVTVPGYVVRKPDDTFDVVMETAIEPPETGNLQERAKALTQRYAEITEGYIRRRPEQWGVFFRVWPEASG